jgi:hypothetical protein
LTLTLMLTLTLIGSVVLTAGQSPATVTQYENDQSVAIVVRARGNLGSEWVDLDVNGVEVATWPVGTDYRLFRHTVADGSDITAIRVGHDSGWWPSAVVIDYIEVDGVRHQSEAPSVWSEGSWDPTNRCGPGIKRSEWISCNDGYFEFKFEPDPPPATTTTRPSTTVPPTTVPSSVAPSSTVPSTTVPATTTTTTSGPADPNLFEPIRNRQSKFTRFADRPESDISVADPLTQAAERPDNGGYAGGGSAAFRIECEYSHFGYDDPIVHPGQPGAAHLHMFFGNTGTDANSTTDSLADSGGGTCAGFELNRSAYWTPALLDGRGNVVVPDKIVVYYKTKNPSGVQRLPQGLQLVGGNLDSADFTVSKYLLWSCGGSGHSYNRTNRIPDCNGDVISAAIAFPSCWDGVNLRSPDNVSHMRYWEESRPCPASHPVRLPDVTVLLYYPGADSVDGWHLSSDAERGSGLPGGSLHADWYGAWHEQAQDLWFDGCIRRARNCSGGQTGTANQLAKLNGLNVYEGDNFLPLPPGSYPNPGGSDHHHR